MTIRLVYSTSVGRVCPSCGRPAGDCRCASSREQAVPATITATLRLESKGRGGKRVTIVDGLPDNQAFLDELARSLKTQCATGGTVRPGAVELSGDVRDRVRIALRARGVAVKG